MSAVNCGSMSLLSGTLIRSDCCERRPFEERFEPSQEFGSRSGIAAKGGRRVATRSHAEWASTPCVIEPTPLISIST